LTLPVSSLPWPVEVTTAGRQPSPSSTIQILSQSTQPATCSLPTQTFIESARSAPAASSRPLRATEAGDSAEMEVRQHPPNWHSRLESQSTEPVMYSLPTPSTIE